jgi:Predicted transcription factor, homolog of eukaryotic MBF1
MDIYIDYHSIGSRIKKTRLKKDITQAKLAEQLSVSPEFLSRVERGNAKPNLPMLARIANILDVTLGYLTDGTVKNSSSYQLAEFHNILLQMSGEKRKLLLEIAKLLIGSET